MAGRGSYRIASIGKYDLTGKFLGEGSFSKVKEAINVETSQKVALKITDLDSFKTDYGRQCCMREAHILGKLDHPSIIKMLDCFKMQNRFIIVLEKMPINMCQLIEGKRKCRLKEFTCRIIFRQVASAIAYLHANDIVHRDVKLENILVCPKSNEVKLTGELRTMAFHAHVTLICLKNRSTSSDFGLSAEWQCKEVFLRTNCGSPEYSAPELQQNAQYTSAVDIWAL
jgi:serine/threonine protein kinase